jgi:hypothetical protein
MNPEQCPVCRRAVSLTTANRIVWRHEDKLGNRCPMSFKQLPVSLWRAAA